MDKANYENIRYEVESGRARITLNRPKKLNSISYEALKELEHAVWEADDDSAVHCIILRGEGRAFCTGYDMTDLSGRRNSKDPTHRNGGSHDDDVWLLERNNRCIRSIWEAHKPVIAQIHGYCLAGGTDLAMGCDMLIAADDAKIGFPAARSMGALPNNLWMYHSGPQWAKRLQLTGDSISGKDAATIGLVLKSVPADQLEDEVEGLADRLSLIDPDLLAANKRITNLGMELMGAQVLQRLAAENDARSHHASAVRDNSRSIKELGLKETLRARDEPFGEGMAHVNEPDGRIIH